MIQFTFLKDHSACQEPMDCRRAEVEEKNHSLERGYNSTMEGVTMKMKSLIIACFKMLTILVYFG